MAVAEIFLLTMALKPTTKEYKVEQKPRSDRSYYEWVEEVDTTYTTEDNITITEFKNTIR